MLCAEWSAKRHCVPRTASDGLGADVAVLTAEGSVSHVAVDANDDQAYTRWIGQHVPANLQHIETGGPIYGRVLDRRMTNDFGCKRT
jgi:hypothetical protein